MAVPLAFGALLAIWPLGWKRAGRSLSVDEPWPDDLEPAADFQITNMAEFHGAREQYRRVTGQIALIKYRRSSPTVLGCVFGSTFAADPSIIPPGRSIREINSMRPAA